MDLQSTTTDDPRPPTEAELTALAEKLEALAADLEQGLRLAADQVYGRDGDTADLNEYDRLKLASLVIHARSMFVVATLRTLKR